MDKHIKKWSEKLLDLSKRNNLISFKDSKTSVIDIVYPNFNKLFDMISDDKSFEIYLDEICSEQLNEKSELISISKERYIENHVRKINNNQLLLFKDMVESNKVLKNIYKKNNEFFQEKGINITHISFGFINWSESSDSSIIYKTPILLIPVTLQRNTNVDPFNIKRIDDIILNPTFSYKLKVEYNLELDPYNSSISITEYLDYIVRVIEKLNWTITKEAKISNLPFSKINMYIDLIENEEIILKNPVIKNIVGESTESSIDLEEVEVKHKNQLNVVSADSSQMCAIDLALKGQSFVLEGPPGTGKSQTITNIIAALLNEGKTVLFVSEKKAALDVVFNNLRKVNLEQFCIPLHGNKLNKKEFINDIFDTMCLGRSEISSSCDDIISKYAYLEQNLDNYSSELHKKNEVINMSLFDVMSELMKLDNINDIEYIISDVSTKDYNNLKDTLENLDKIKSHLQNYGLNFTNHYFYGIKHNDLSYQFNIEFKKYLNNIKSLSIDLNNIKSLSIDLNNKNLINTSIINIVNYSNLKIILKEYNLNDNNELFNNIEFYLSNAIELKEIAVKANEIENELLLVFKEELFDIDSSNIFEELSNDLTSPINRFFSSSYKSIRKKFELNLNSKAKLSYNDLLKYSELLKKYNKLVKSYNEIDKLNDLKIIKYNNRKTNWDLFISDISFVKENIDLVDVCSTLSNLSNVDYKSFINEVLVINDLVSNETYFNNELFNLNKLSINELFNKIDNVINNYDKLHSWMNFLVDLDLTKKYNTFDYLVKIINSNLELNNLVEYYLKTFYLQLFDVMAKDTRLHYFDIEDQERMVKGFRQTDEDMYKISIDKIISQLSSYRPNVSNKVPGSASAILAREHEKKSRVKSILTLMTEIPQFIQEIKPCFLMSPLAVSTYLNPNHCNFDVTIFDEASQIFPHDAVGAIYRSKQAIVVGDSKQMPPTNFFNSNDSLDDIDEEDVSDVDAFESILDLFKSSFPTRSLLWHYRSKVEELISFSNEKYYNSNLISFPSTYPDEQYYGVDFHFVENGMYSPNDRVNIMEANRVVDLIFENIKQFPNRSLGVIAFNKAQQEKIEDILENRRKECSDYDGYFSAVTSEPFFIKNLETVQGDERDTIIFSICFGKNASGVFRQNFGPLSLSGGERRLNVAVTRAKFNLQVVSSIVYTDINITNVKNEGPKHLRTYLDFAQNGLSALDRQISVCSDVSFDSYFEEDVYNFIKSKGYEIDTQVGCSNYKIDLALKEENSSKYFLAIECDGATYHSSKTARDRDKLRQSVLETKGWNFYRIWSTDWFKNNKNAKEKLLEYIENAKNNKIEIEKYESLYNSNLSVIEEDTNLFDEYVFFDLDNINSLKVRSNEFSNRINEWIKVESPLSIDVLIKRVCINFKSEKVTSRVKEDFMIAFKKDPNILYRERFFYLPETLNNKLRVISNGKREIEFISRFELASGLYSILKSTSQCAKDNLFKFLATELGYKNVTAKSKTLLDNAFVLLRPFVIEENGLYRIDKSVEFILK